MTVAERIAPVAQPEVFEAVGGLVLARALGGREIYCDDVATRQRMIAKVQRSEDERLSAAKAARAARAGLFA